MPPSTSELEDYWQILGLEPGASKEEVRKAYRKRSLAVHPDRYKGSDPEGATAEFLRLTRAKEVLEDDKARAAFEAVVRARAMHKEKQAAQDGARKKMREDLEAREEEARKRSKTGPSAAAEAQQARQQAATEAEARKELQRELERLRRTGRLGGDRAASTSAAAPATTASAAPAASSSGSASAHPMAKLTLRWAAGTAMSEASLRELLRDHGAPPDVLVAMAGSKAVVELAPNVASKLAERTTAFAARGVRVAVQMPDGSGDDGGGQNRWDESAPMPSGWREVRTQDSAPYFYHVATRWAQWARPAAAATAAAAAAHSRADFERFEQLTLQRLRQAGDRQRREV